MIAPMTKELGKEIAKSLQYNERTSKLFVVTESQSFDN